MLNKQARVILFRPKSTYGVVYVPWALLAISAPIVAEGVSVRIIDENISSDWRLILEEELKKNPLCLGVTALTGRMIRGAIEASKMAHGITKVVWGGVHASLLPEQTIKENYIDYVVVGEGEESFKKLIHCMMTDKEPTDVPGVYFKSNNNVKKSSPQCFVDLASQPEPPWELLDMDNYISGWFGQGSRVLDIFTSRGCPHRCKFCYNTTFNARKWRSFDVQTSYERIKEFVERFKLTGVIIRDDFFFANRKRVYEIAGLLAEKGPRIEWEADCRIDAFAALEEDYIKLLVKSGLKKLVFGVESGSPRVLEAIGKDMTLDELWITVDKIKRHGIQSAFHFMIGFPGESWDEVLETYRVIEKVKEKLPHAPIYGPNVYVPYPGTELFGEAVKMGFVPPEKLEEWINFEGWTFANTPWVSSYLESMLDVSRIYFRMGEVFPALRPIGRLRRSLWGISKATPKVERKTLNLLLRMSANTWIRRLHLKRWADK